MKMLRTICFFAFVVLGLVSYKLVSGKVVPPRDASLDEVVGCSDLIVTVKKLTSTTVASKFEVKKILLNHSKDDVKLGELIEVHRAGSRSSHMINGPLPNKYSSTLKNPLSDSEEAILFLKCYDHEFEFACSGCMEKIDQVEEIKSLIRKRGKLTSQ